MRYKRSFQWGVVVLLAKLACAGIVLADWDIQRSAVDSFTYLPAFINDMWASDSGEVMAVGDNGTALLRDETGWHDLSPNSQTSFRLMWGPSADHVFAVGFGGAIYRFDGNQWQPMLSGTYHHLAGIWGAAADDVFAVGDVGTIVHYNGAVWSPMASLTDEDLIFVNGASGRDVLAISAQGGVFHYDGFNWSKVSAAGRIENPYQSWASSIRNIYAIAGNELMHFDGAQWASVPNGWGVLASISAVGGVGPDLYLIGYDQNNLGHIFVLHNDSWQELPDPETLQGFVIVFARSVDDLYVYGPVANDGAGIFKYDGAAWRLIGSTAGAEENLLGVWGNSSTDVTAVGEKGLVCHYDGTGWQTVSSGTASDLRDVWGHAETGVLAVGDQGVVLRCDGDRCTPLISSTEQNLVAISGDASGKAYIVGSGGTILYCDGSTCSPMESGTSHNLTDVWVNNGGEAYAVGRDKTFLVLKEGRWSPVGSLPEAATDLYSIWGGSPTDLYINSGDSDQGPYSAIWRFDGLTWKWNALGDLDSENLHGITAQDLFSVAIGAPFIRHYDGTRWTSVTPCLNKHWNRLWGDATDLFLVGANGSIAHSARMDRTSPHIVSTNPPDGASGVSPYSNIEIVFSEPMDGKVTMSDGSVQQWDEVEVAITDDTGRRVDALGFMGGAPKITGWAELEAGKTYIVTVAGTAADFAGNVLGVDYTWSFTTQSLAASKPAGAWITPELWIGAWINTGDQGEIEGRWQAGGEDTTARGDRVVWGYFYADPADVDWGDPNNPDLFVKIWFDMTGAVYISYFHVSVPEIQVWSSFPNGHAAQAPGENGTVASLSKRHVGHYYNFNTYSGEYYTYSNSQFEDGQPTTSVLPAGSPTGTALMGGSLRIGAVINTEYNGPLEGRWRLGGQATTQRGDQVLWGYVYADPAVVNWGSAQNPDLFVKTWYDISGAVFVDFFHVSVPDIEVFSEMPINGAYAHQGTTILSDRFIEHRYQR